MKKYFAAAASIAFVTLALIFCTISIAQMPAATNPAATFPPIPAASASALAALAPQLSQLDAQIAQLNVKRAALQKQWNIAANAALVNAQPPQDPCSVGISRDGTKFVNQRNLSPNCR